MAARLTRGLFIPLLFISFSLSAQTWTGGGDVTNWNDPTNWSSNPSLPSNGANIIIDGSTVTLNVVSSFSPADISIINGGSLTIAAGGAISASDDIFITGNTSSLTVSGGTIAGSDNMIVTDGIVTIGSGELELLGRPDFTGGSLDVQGGLLDLNGSGTSDDLTLNGTTFTMSGGTLENDRGITTTNGTFQVSGGTMNQSGSGSSDDMIFNNSTITFSGGIVKNDQELYVNDGSLTIESGGTYYSDKNLIFTGSATGDLGGTIDLEYNVSPTTGGDLSLFGTTVVNINIGSEIKMDDLVLNDDGQSSTLNIYGTLTAFDDIKFDEDPPDDTAGDSDQVIVKDGGTLTITDNFRDADVAESGSNIHVESGGTADIGGLSGVTDEEAYGSLLTSDSGGTLRIGGGDPLPVELMYFNSQITDEGILLHWSTASEVNNAYFEVLRSNDGIHFNPISRVNGHGSSHEIIEYLYLDKTVTPGTYFYQLKQVDHDGLFEYHPVILVLFSGYNESSIRVFPNPVARGNITIQSSNQLIQPILKIYSLSGRLVLEKSMNSSRQWSFTLDELNLTSGTYILKLNDLYTGQSFTTAKISISK